MLYEVITESQIFSVYNFCNRKAIMHFSNANIFCSHPSHFISLSCRRLCSRNAGQLRAVMFASGTIIDCSCLPDQYTVITSYSIHYTKLYETGS